MDLISVIISLDRVLDYFYMLTSQTNLHYDSVCCQTKFVNPFPNNKYSGKFSELGRENTVGNGEIARYEQFLLFPWWFQRQSLQTRKNKRFYEKGLVDSKII